MRRLVHGVIALLLIYTAACAAVFLLQRKLQYLPDATPMPPPAAAGLARGVAEELTTPDGEHLVAWWIPPGDEAQPVFLYLHGNGANLTNRVRRFERLTADGAGLLAVSWRGYGGSSGAPTEPGLLADARTAYAWLAARVVPRRIVLYGESLGTTVAVLLAAEAPVAALVLDSSFDSALAVAGNTYPWLPVSLLLRDTYRADLAAARVKVPVWQVHCRDDPLTPLHFAEKLNVRLPQRRPLHVVEERCHVPSISNYEEPMRAFVRGAMSLPP
jgi:pimeloyl-ACP methyl ester carboxylesterase